MATLPQFARRISVRSDRVGRNISNLVRRIALAIDQSVVQATPVDTGAARSNWLVSLSQARTEAIGAYAPGQGLGIDEQANTQGALAQGQAVIAARREGQDIIIANNLPYIGKLNDGSSSQAPANFVELAVMEGSAAIRGTRIVTNRL